MRLNKSVIRTYDQEKIPYAGSAIDISQPDMYRYEVNRRLSRNEPMMKTLTVDNRYRDDLNNTEYMPTYANTQTFSKSRNATMPKRVNSMARILEWQPHVVNKLNLINEKKNMYMQKSLKNIIPYRENSIGKCSASVFSI